MGSNTILAKYGTFFSNRVKVAELYTAVNPTVAAIKINMNMLTA
jgi:hypothetical protein